MPNNERPDPWEAPTIDEIVARNLRSLREDMELSREGLAKRLNGSGGRRWSAWRIIDLEGARSPDRPPRPITWPEIVAISFALDVTVFEIVLPRDTETAVAVSSRVWDVPHEPPAEDGEDSQQTYRHSMGADLFSRTLFRIPAELATSDRLTEAGMRLNYEASTAEIARDYAAITRQIDDLSRRVKELDHPSEDT